MAATNPITNAKIISKPFSSAYADGWDAIYLKTPEEWSLICGQNLKNLDSCEDQFVGTRMTKKQFKTLFGNG
jgi:hypothetical protein